MFEAGFVLVDCESYFVVLSQKQFASYRRVTAAAVNRVTSHEQANNESTTAPPTQFPSAPPTSGIAASTPVYSASS